MGPETTMAVVRELREFGLIQGKDFEFKYTQAQYNNDSWTEISPRGTEFYLREGKWITYLSLKYAT